MRLTFTEVFANTAYYYYLSRLATSLTYLQIYIFTDRYTDSISLVTYASPSSSSSSGSCAAVSAPAVWSTSTILSVFVDP